MLHTDSTCEVRALVTLVLNYCVGPRLCHGGQVTLLDQPSVGKLGWPAVPEGSVYTCPYGFLVVGSDWGNRRYLPLLFLAVPYL